MDLSFKNHVFFIVLLKIQIKVFCFLTSYQNLLFFFFFKSTEGLKLGPFSLCLLHVLIILLKMFSENSSNVFIFLLHFKFKVINCYH